MATMRLRYVWSRLSNMTINYRTIPVSLLCKPRRITSYIPFLQRPKYIMPVTLGFSLFTWLGFEKQLTAEDELIDTIKHCVLFIQRLEYEKAEQLLHIALRQAQQLQNHLGITYIYDVMANLALEREQLEKAKKLFVSVSQRIMADGATEDDSRVVHISAKLARISHLKKDYTTAQIGYEWCIDKLQKAYSQEPIDSIKKLLALTEDWYGRLFLECGQSENALKLMIRSLEKMKEIPDVEKEHIVVQMNDIGTVYDKLNKSDESIEYFQEAINIGKTLDMKEEIGALHVNLGRAYIKKHMLDDARRNCGYAWKVAVNGKFDDVKEEASMCLKEIKDLS